MITLTLHFFVYYGFRRSKRNDYQQLDTHSGTFVVDKQQLAWRNHITRMETENERIYMKSINSHIYIYKIIRKSAQKMITELKSKKLMIETA